MVNIILHFLVKFQIDEGFYFNKITIYFFFSSIMPA